MLAGAYGGVGDERVRKYFVIVTRRICHEN